MIDSIISYLSPSWAVKRAAARAMLRQGFDATIIDRHRARGGYQSLSAQEETMQNRQSLCNQSRRLVRDNPWLSGVYTSIVDNVVGCGINPDVRVIGGGNQATVRARTLVVRDAFMRWAESVDLTGRVSLYEQQRQVAMDKDVAGEVLVIKRIDEKGKLLLEAVESERLSEINEELPGNRVIIQGVEFNSLGRIEAYHIHPNDPRDSISTAEATVRIDAENVLHIFEPKRIGSVRGLAKAAPVIQTLTALKQYLNFELTRARVASAFALFIKRHGTTPLGLPAFAGGEETSDTAGNALSNIEGGMILQGKPGEELQTGGANIHSTAFDPFVSLMLRSCAIGMGISYELLAKDFTKTNFSSARQSSLEDRKAFRAGQKLMIGKYCSPVFEWWLDSYIAGGDSGGIRRDSIQAKWKPGGFEWIDPQKEVNARKEAVKAGFESPQSVVGERGQDFEEVLFEIKEAQEKASALGVSLDIFGSQQGTQEESQQAESENNEE